MNSLFRKSKTKFAFQLNKSCSAIVHGKLSIWKHSFRNKMLQSIKNLLSEKEMPGMGSVNTEAAAADKESP